MGALVHLGKDQRAASRRRSSTRTLPREFAPVLPAAPDRQLNQLELVHISKTSYLNCSHINLVRPCYRLCKKIQRCHGLVSWSFMFAAKTESPLESLQMPSMKPGRVKNEFGLIGS